MIPIECPKCGRGGSVPPDRLNARLVCKACHTVFHLDNTGRMVLGEPESFDMKTTKARASEPAGADFDLAQTWNDIPAPVKYGVPVVLLAAVLYLNLGTGGGNPDYESRATTLIKSVTSNDKSKALSLATTESAADAEKWFDLVKLAAADGKIGDDANVTASLFSGNPEKDSSIVLLVVVSQPGGAGAPLAVNVPMRLDGGTWKFDASGGLESAQRAMNAMKNKK